MPRQPQQILSHEEQGEYLWLLMRPHPRHGAPEANSSWWRKTLRGNELVEVGNRPTQHKTPAVRISSLDKRVAKGTLES